METRNVKPLHAERIAAVEGNGLGGGVQSESRLEVRAVQREAVAGRLSAYHHRCLDKRVGDCNDALAQAVCALCQAKIWEPGDVRLHAVCGLLKAAHSLTDLARDLCHEATPDRDADSGEFRP